MINRRNLLLSGSIAVLSAAIPVSAATIPETESRKLNALFATFAEEDMTIAPELATAMGLDTGNNAALKHRLSDLSPAGDARRRALTKSQLARLNGIDTRKLSGLDASNYAAVRYDLTLQSREARNFAFIGASWTPYVLSQLSGAYSTVPDLLSSQHGISGRDDAEAYLDRLNAFADELNQEIESAKHDIGLGVVPPDFVIARTIPQIAAVRRPQPEASPLTRTLADRAKATNIDGDYAAKAARIVRDRIYPALDAQIALVENLKPKTTHAAGVGRLPDGAAYYAARLESQTTTTMSPAEVHKMGLELVKEISAEIDVLMKPLGLTEGSAGARMHAMFGDKKFLYPNTDAGKTKLLSDLNAKIRQVQALLPNYFDVLPRAKVEIVRIPPETEAGAPGGYYMNGAIDGSRPGRVYINLRDTAELPAWTLPTLIFHEGIPGHHLQLSIAAETGLPLLRKMAQYNAYVEGWAVYAEQLAAEMGMYRQDPYGHIGQLHDALLRAVRLVLDSGIHALGWSREKAVAYYCETLGDPESAAVSEVERYCVWPGQACGYMVGKRTMLALRARAKAALGTKFDIKGFHDAVLLSGALPLKVLDGVVNAWIARTQA